MTEASPVLAVNTAAFNKNGTVGRLLPFIEARLEPVPGIDEGRQAHRPRPQRDDRLLSAPTIPASSNRHPAAGTTPATSWRSTRRASSRSRAAPSASPRSPGETRLARRRSRTSSPSLWPDDLVAAVAAPDPKRGERVILATTRRARPGGGPGLAEDQGRFRRSWRRTSVVVLDPIPLLGSGKTDYVALTALLRETEA